MAKEIKIHCKGSGTRDLKSLKILQGTLKELSKENYEKLKARIEKYGFDAPFFVYGDYILDGTQRKRVIDKMLADGFVLPNGEVPIVEINAKDVNEAKERLLGYISQYGNVTEEGLYEFINSIPEADLSTLDLPDFDFEGFSAGWLNDDNEGLTPEDSVPEVEENEPITQKDDLWLLGEHRLLCGDATKKEDVETLMAGEKADMVFTDPPYGVNYTGGSSNPKPREDVDWDEWTQEEYSNLVYKALAGIGDFVSDSTAYYIWFGDANIWSLLQGCHKAGIQERYCVIWRKLNPHYGALGRQYKMQHEPCLYAHKKGKTPQWFGSSTEGTIWEYEQPRINELHSTQKPIILAKRAIKNSSKQKEAVIDIFLGSGSTLIACEKTNRRCFGMEIDPHYCDVIIKRWEEYTGEKAKREAE